MENKKMSVTEEDIQNMIVKEEVTTLGTKVTACCITLKNGFEVVGLSGCVSAQNYSQEIGAQYARQDAINKIWQLAGYELQLKNAGVGCCVQAGSDTNGADMNPAA